MTMAGTIGVMVAMVALVGGGIILGYGITGATATVGAAHGDGTDGTTGATDMDMDMDMDMDITVTGIIMDIMETATMAVMATITTGTTEIEEVIITPIPLRAIARQEI
jgi:hypothetical protein